MSARKTPVKLNDEMEQCSVILKQVMEKTEADPFLSPVDWKALELPDYPQIIKHPMDLGTVESKLSTGKYASADQFAKEVNLVWSNAMTYNRSDSAIYSTAEKLKNIFDKKFKALKGTSSSTNKKRKRGTPGKPGEVREVTKAERVKFSQLVGQLSSPQLSELVSKIQKQCPKALREDDEDELEIEINSVDASVLLDLIQYANDCIQNNSAAKKKKK